MVIGLFGSILYLEEEKLDLEVQAMKVTLRERPLTTSLYLISIQPDESASLVDLKSLIQQI